MKPTSKIEFPGVGFWYPKLSNISPKAKIGFGSTIHSGVHIHDNVIIGKKCQIQAGALLFNGVTLEDDVFIGPGVIFTNDPKLNKERIEWKPTSTLVKKGAKIGAGAMIRAGVTIGERAIIGMGSVVLNDVPNGEVWVGNPAKKMLKEIEYNGPFEKTPWEDYLSNSV